MNHKNTYVHANGIDIHYREQGSGAPLLLLHGGLLSTASIWDGFEASYAPHMASLAQHFRVIAPDLRGHGRTKNREPGPISHEQLADDALALVDALGLDRPVLAGFSVGATVATIAAIRRPAAIRALVNHAGCDALGSNPNAPTFVKARQVFGGRPDAVEADPASFERFALEHGMTDFFDRLKRDHGNDPDAWRVLVRSLFGALTAPGACHFEDLRTMTAPALILVGDRDFSCSVEDAVLAFRTLPNGTLAVLPNEGHTISEAAIAAAITFLRRQAL